MLVNGNYWLRFRRFSDILVSAEMSAVVNRFLEEILEKNTKTQKTQNKYFPYFKKRKRIIFSKANLQFTLEKKIENRCLSSLPCQHGGKILNKSFFLVSVCLSFASMTMTCIFLASSKSLKSFSHLTIKHSSRFIASS